MFAVDPRCRKPQFDLTNPHFSNVLSNAEFVRYTNCYLCIFDTYNIMAKQQLLIAMHGDLCKAFEAYLARINK